MDDIDSWNRNLATSNGRKDKHPDFVFHILMRQGLRIDWQCYSRKFNMDMTASAVDRY